MDEDKISSIKALLAKYEEIEILKKRLFDAESDFADMTNKIYTLSPTVIEERNSTYYVIVREGLAKIESVYVLNNTLKS